jgi:hypothetical protein
MPETFDEQLQRLREFVAREGFERDREPDKTESGEFMDVDDIRVLAELLRRWDVQSAILAHMACPQCLDEHGENPQSVSCYCGCHHSQRDEQRWKTLRPTDAVPRGTTETVALDRNSGVD